MLGWSTKRIAKLVQESLRGAPPGGVAVLGEPALAQLLARPGREVAASTDGGELAALVAVGEGTREALEAWSGALRDGGVLIVIDRTAPALATRRALCAALHDLEQRQAGKLVVTSGRVRRWV